MSPSIYSFMLSIGVCIGNILAGHITIDRSCRFVFWVAVALNGGVATLMLFTLPETFVRNSTLNPLNDREATYKTEEESDDHQIETVEVDRTRVAG